MSVEVSDNPGLSCCEAYVDGVLAGIAAHTMRGDRIAPQCPFVQGYPEYADLT